MNQPLAIHLEPYHREPFLEGDLVPVDEVQIAVLAGPWDEQTQNYARMLIRNRIQPYLYLQSFTEPLVEWRNTEPSMTLGEIPPIPLVKSWAYGREAIDWSRARLPLHLDSYLPPEVGAFLDNYFPDLEPWMFGATDWYRVPSLGATKRKAHARMVRSFAAEFQGRVIFNGRPDPIEPRDWVMVERAAARKVEADAVAATGKALLSIPAEETYNLGWLLERWKNGNAISFTSDAVEGISSAASIYAYQAAIQYRKKGDPS